MDNTEHFSNKAYRIIYDNHSYKVVFNDKIVQKDRAYTLNRQLFFSKTDLFNLNLV